MSHVPASDLVPLRWHGLDGYALSLPPSCVGFLVRFWPPSARGMGERVIDEDTGLPLVMPVETTTRDFCELVGNRVGRYRLSPVDRRCRPVRAPDAEMHITDVMAARVRGWVSFEACADTIAPLHEREERWTATQHVHAHVLAFGERVGVALANGGALALVHVQAECLALGERVLAVFENIDADPFAQATLRTACERLRAVIDSADAGRDDAGWSQGRAGDRGQPS